MSTAMALFSQRLAQQSSQIATLLAEHMADYDELLPNVFLADVTRYILSNNEDRPQIVQFLEHEFGSQNKDVENLIAVSFVENLDSSDELLRATEGVDAPRIRAEWNRQRSS